MAAQFEVLTGVRATLGESPLWHSTERAFYWVDIVERRVFRYGPTTEDSLVVFQGEMVTAMGELGGGGLVMVTPERLLAFVDGDIESLAELSLPDRVRTNDAKTGPDGRLWFGTMDLEVSQPIGELYTYDGETVRRVQDRIVLSNGLGWNPAGDVFYHVESVARLMYSYRYEAGEITNRQVLVDMTGQAAQPDGLAVDVDGNIWVAMWDGWRVDVYGPTGRKVHTEGLDIQRPTSLAFGGDDLTDLYVTTASEGLGPDDLVAQPDAGKLLRFRPGISGLPVGLFDCR